MRIINKIKQFSKNQKELLALHGPKVRFQHFLKKNKLILIKISFSFKNKLIFIFGFLSSVKHEALQISSTNFKKISPYYNFQKELELLNHQHCHLRVLHLYLQNTELE